MQAEQDFHKTLLYLQRPINCLTDDDRNTRKSGLSTILSEMDKIQVNNLIRLFTETNLQQYLVKRTLWDKIENNRELTLKIIAKFNQKVKKDQIKNDQLKPFIEELVKRINNTPFPETSQDLRLDTIQLLQKLVINYQDAFSWYLPELASALSKTLADPYAQIKHASHNLVNTLSGRFKQNLGSHSVNIIKSLAQNLTHQHSKVRKGTLTSAAKILITHNAGNNFQHIQVSLKSALSDKSAEVRKEAVICAAILLKGFGPKYMKMYEANLVGYLLTGLSDQSEDIVNESIKQLEQCGQAIKQMEAISNQHEMQAEKS